jgi:uncharacterized membrane protein YedE/YeeE
MQNSHNPPFSLLDSPVTRIRACLPSIAISGAKVAALCILIALGIWWTRAEVGLDNTTQRLFMGLDVQLVYSLSTGITTWLFIDLGRFFIDRSSPYQFPRGWRAPALILGGCLLGHLLGMQMGDAYSGASTWSLLHNKPRLSFNFFLLSMVAGGVVSYFFYSHGKAHYLRSELEASQRQATQAQLALLQSQLEPHMLFNTLANLRALISTDPERATAMLDRLNDYLRATLGASRASVQPLSKEFARLADYLELMAVRMGTRLTYALDLPPALAEVSIPSLLLQPLVENSIKHGLEPTVKGGRIEVRAQLATDGRVQILVSDNGVGFGDRTEPAEGFGLAHVRERLLSAYGTQGTMEIVANNDHMTLTLVKFPVNMGVKYV